MKNSNGLFYTNLENTDEIDCMIKKFENYAEQGTNPVYIINRPLEEKNISYNYEQTACREYLFVWKGREHVLVK